MPKVKFGFKNVYYSTITEEEGVVTYSDPKRLPGAVSTTLSPVGESTDFYADDSEYFSDTNNNGYDGTLEMARIPEEFLKDILGEEEDKNFVLKENAIKISNPFALLCEFTEDDGAKKFVFYNCKATRPELSSSTKTNTKEVQTETLNLTIRPNASGDVKCSTTSKTPTEVIENWYKKVYIPGQEE